MTRKFAKDESGMETVEWAVVAALIVLAAVAAFRNVGGSVTNRIQNVDTTIRGTSSNPNPPPAATPTPAAAPSPTPAPPDPNPCKNKKC